MPIKVRVSESRLRQIASNIITLVMRKNADYGDAWQAQGRIGALVRMMDKGMRFINLTNNTTVFVTDETLKDTIMDLVGYGLLILLHYEEMPIESVADTETGSQEDAVASILRRLSSQERR